uniref:Putative secreted protein n=1 Tax=Anopheles darlingi TaxID=43151 RepID=A0A2M4DGA0_ANODA
MAGCRSWASSAALLRLQHALPIERERDRDFLSFSPFQLDSSSEEGSAKVTCFRFYAKIDANFRGILKRGCSLDFKNVPSVGNSLERFIYAFKEAELTTIIIPSN